MSFPRYPAYKDSGVEWLGEVPTHWVISKLGFESTVKARLGWKGLKADEYVNEGHIFLSTPNIKSGRIDFEGANYITDERYYESPEIMLKLGDVLVVKDGATLGIVNVIRDLPGTATVNSSIAVVRPGSSIESVYLYYFFSSNYTQQVIQRMKDGMGVPHLFQDDLRKFAVVLPPPHEQRAIAAFLDAETARIDALVAKQEALIATLQEKRRALISHAVTRGLDPAAPMKDSGVPWLGTVPAHWEVCRVKEATEVLRGKFTHRPRNDPALYDGPYPFIQTGDVASASKHVEHYTQTLNEKGFAVSKEFPAGTLVMTIAANIGDVAILNFDACFPDSIVGFTPRRASVDYLYLLFDAMKPVMLSTATLNTQMNLNIERISSLQVAIPPTKEQQLIVDHVEIETRRIDTLIAKARAFIELLREHRMALVAAAVTGQIDVRGWEGR